MSEWKSQLPWKLMRSDVAAVERLIGAKLPREYVRWQGKYNGPESSKTCVDYRGKGRRRDRVAWVGISPVRRNEPDRVLSVEEQWGIILEHLPANTLSIGHGVTKRSDASILMYIRGPRYGQVWVKNWEADRPGNRKTANMYKLANSFDEFMEKLYEPEDDE